MPVSQCGRLALMEGCAMIHDDCETAHPPGNLAGAEYYKGPNFLLTVYE